MKLNKGSGFALILIAFGALLLLNKIGLGFGFGHLFGYLIPVALVVLGYVGVKNGKTLIGWALIVFGAIFLLGKLSGLIGIVIAIALIVYGFSLLKKNTA